MSKQVREATENDRPTCVGRWKKIPEYPNYSVSDGGLVRNDKTGRILKIADTWSGYARVGLCKESKQKWFFVHNLVAKAFIPNTDPEADQVNHKDGNGLNNKVENLEWVTKAYNAAYSHTKKLLVYKDQKAVGRMTRSAAMQLIGCCETTLNKMYTEGLVFNGYECIQEDLTLAMMYKMQSKLQHRLGFGDFETAQEHTQYIKHHAQYLDQELHEMMRELQFFKEWKQYNWDDDEVQKHWAAAKEELVDAFHFMINISLALGLTADELAKIYVAKNITNHERQDNNY